MPWACIDCQNIVGFIVDRTCSGQDVVYEVDITFIRLVYHVCVLAIYYLIQHMLAEFWNFINVSVCVWRYFCLKIFFTVLNVSGWCLFFYLFIHYSFIHFVLLKHRKNMYTRALNNENMRARPNFF